MRNPWLKKNPFMSMWLSGVNSAANSVRGRATAEAKRQTSSAMTQATNDMLRFWTGGLAGASTKRRKKSR